MLKFITACSLLLLSTNLLATNLVNIEPTAAESILNWLAEDCPESSIAALSALPGNQLLQQLLQNKEPAAGSFQQALQQYARQQELPQPDYLLPATAANAAEVTELLAEIKDRDFSVEIEQRVLKYFPADFAIPGNYQILLVTNGWKWGDAMTFQYQKDAERYQLVASGIPAIIFNLTLVAQTYGSTTEARLQALKDVICHEVFHAIFADYTKSQWHEENPLQFSEEVMKLILNEGLAHYIANGAAIATVYQQSEDIRQKESRVFQLLQSNSELIFSDSASLESRRQTALAGTFGPFWEKYLCLSGLFMIYHIEQQMGEKKVVECVQKGSKYFLQTYANLSRKDSDLPILPEPLLKLLN